MDPDELLGPNRVFRKVRDGNGGGVGGEDRALGHGRFGCFCCSFLDRGVLEHGLDDQIAALQMGVIIGRRDQGQQGLLALGSGTALLHRRVFETGGMGLALVRSLLVAVDQDDRNPGLCGDIGNARAHEAGADNADLLELGGFDAFRTACALVEFLQ